MELFPIIMISVLALGCIGGIAYNPLRRKYEGVIGVFGSYLIATGIGMLILAITSISDSGFAGMALPLIVAAVALLYMIYVMIVKCKTLKQRIFLPFAALLIGFGFAIRITLAIFLHIPMASPEKETSLFPEVLIDPNGEEFRRESGNSQMAEYYCMRTGQRVQFWETDMPPGKSKSFGWRAGS